MALEFLNLDVEDRLAVVRLGRPAARNAFSQALMRELTAEDGRKSPGGVLRLPRARARYKRAG